MSVIGDFIARVRVQTQGAAETQAQMKKLGQYTDEVADHHAALEKQGKATFNTLEKGVIGVANQTKSFSKMASSMGSGSTSMVGIYATLAANVFALSAAFNTLRGAAQVQQVLAGLDTIGNRMGVTLKGTAEKVQALAGGMLDMEQSARSTAQFMSSGLRGGQDTLLRMTQLARDASIALGRNMTDSMDRLTKGIVKLQPELLDELGIMTRIGPAVSIYAAQHHKAVGALTTLERNQAFANAVLAEGELKFKGVSDAAGDTAAYDKLAAAFKNLSLTVINGLNTGLLPFISALSESKLGMLGFVTIFVSSIRKQLLPFFNDLGASSAKFADIINTKNVNAIGAFSDQLNDSSHDIIHWIGDVEKGTARASDLAKVMEETQNEIAARQGHVAAGTFPVGESLAENEEQLAVLKSLNVELANYQRLSGRAAGHSFISSGINQASMGSIGAGFKDLRKGFDALNHSVDPATGLLGKFQNTAVKTGASLKFLGASFLYLLPYIGILIAVGGTLYAMWTKMTPAQEKLAEAQKDFTRDVEAVNGKVSELFKVHNSLASASARATQAITIQAGATNELSDAYDKLLQAQDTFNKSNAANAIDTELGQLYKLRTQGVAAGSGEGVVAEGTADSGVEARIKDLEEQKKLADQLGVSAHSYAFQLMNVGDIGNKALAELTTSMEKINPDLFKQLAENLGGVALKYADPIARQNSLNILVGEFTDREEAAMDAVSGLNDAFKQTETAVGAFIQSNQASTPFDNMANALRLSVNAAQKLNLELGKGAITSHDFAALMSGIGTDTQAIMGPGVSKAVDNFTAADSALQVANANLKTLTVGTAAYINQNKQITALTEKKNETEKVVNSVVLEQLQTAAKLTTEYQRATAVLSGQITILQNQRATYADMYQYNGKGLAEQYKQEEEIRNMQVKQIDLQMQSLKNIIANTKAKIDELEAQKEFVKIQAIQLWQSEQIAKFTNISTSASRIASGKVDLTEAQKTEQLAALKKQVDEANTPEAANQRRLDLQSRINAASAGQDLAIQALKNTLNDTQNAYDELRLKAQGILAQNLTAAQKVSRETQKNVELSQKYLDMIKQQADLLGQIRDTDAKIGEITSGNLSTIATEVVLQRASTDQQIQQAKANRDNQISTLEAQRGVVEANLARASASKDATDSFKDQIKNIDSEIAGITQLTELQIVQLDHQQTLNELQLANFNVGKEGLDWQQQGIDMMQKTLDLAKDLNTQQLQNNQLREQNSRIRMGIPTTNQFTARQELQVKEQSYLFAIKELKVRETAVDLEYALLDAQKLALEEELRQRKAILAADDQRGENTPKILELDRAIQNLESVSTSAMRDQAKAALREQADALRLQMEQAALPVSAEFNKFLAPFQTVFDAIALRQEQNRARIIAGAGLPATGASGAVVTTDNSIKLNPQLTAMDQSLKNVLPVMTEVRNYNEEIANNTASLVNIAGRSVTPNMSGGGATANAKTAMQFFMGKGLSAADSAAIVGNLQQESGANLSTTAHNDIKGGHSGIAQWDVNRQKQFMDKYGVPVLQASLDKQLDFVWTELQGRYKTAITAMNSVDTVVGKAIAFEAKFEVSGADLDKRSGNALKLMQSISQAVDAINTTIDTGNRAKGVTPASDMSGQPAIVVKAKKSVDLTPPDVNLDTPSIKDSLPGPGIDDMLTALPQLSVPPTFREDLQASSDLLASMSTQFTSMADDLGPGGKVAAALTGGMSSFINTTLQAVDSVKKGGDVLTAVFNTISAGIGAVDSIMAASAQAREANIDTQIAAEQRIDGQSAQSVAKIAALQKQKDDIARKEFNTHKKLMMAEAVMSTAAGVAGALRLPPPMNFILAGITAALGAAQIAIIAGTQYQSTAPATTAAKAQIPTLSIGAQGDTVDLAKGNPNPGGEIAYLRGARGTGSNASNFQPIGSAYGGTLPRGYGNTAFWVGEKGPELIEPTMPMTVTPATDAQPAGKANGPVHFHIQTLDAKGVEQVLLGQRGNIISMLREAANASGQTFLEDVNTHIYTSPRIEKL